MNRDGGSESDLLQNGPSATYDFLIEQHCKATLHCTHNLAPHTATLLFCILFSKRATVLEETDNIITLVSHHHFIDNNQTTNLYKHNIMLGRIVHYGVDAVVLSALLAGVKRSAGLT